jgi:hypothetical protein
MILQRYENLPNLYDHSGKVAEHIFSPAVCINSNSIVPNCETKNLLP